MKSVIRSLFNSFGYKIERKTNPNPLESKYHNLIMELLHMMHTKGIDHVKSLDEKNKDLITNLDGTQVIEALFILNSLAKTKQLEGDVCEFGVAQGFTSSLIAYNIKETDKKLWLYDSFEGLPKPTNKDELKDDIFKLGDIQKYQGTMKHSQENLIRNLENSEFNFSSINIISGFIEDTISSLPDKLCFAYVDFDFYQPIKVTLAALHKIIVDKGIILIDDYDFFSTGAKKAVDEFLELHEEYYTAEIIKPPIGGFAILSRKKR